MTPSARPRGERRPAVFLDRDGTLNREVDYLADPELFELLPGVGEALARLAAAGFALVVVTNQSGIARGLLDEDVLAAIHARMARDLAEHGVALDLVLHCPHHPTDAAPTAPAWTRARCSCRKPKPGMYVEATARLGLDPARSWAVGDSLRDLEAGAVIGARG
ncbi:MAG: HAD family hydrolase, partial [Planctomycetota bacterium]